ncbi:unnamed protein product [Aureobasidium vineae]|uniref:CFEM domain-containing protein n=1 Tax=Aureobasidium vineae TaxID=2773715 RepID=A0A9N8JX56_9PEZI|nr:unnamed protein product [Aureobasidium vineae]
MRSSTFFFAGLVAVAHAAIDASIIAQIPACATGPLVSGISASGCQVTDSDCICGNQKLISDLQSAVKAQCSESDLAITSQICPEAAAPAADVASSASDAATSAASVASSISSVAATAGISTDSVSPVTTAPSMGTGSAMINYTATTGDYTPPAPTATLTPSTGGAAQSFALGSIVMGIGALGVFFAGL